MSVEARVKSLLDSVPLLRFGCADYPYERDRVDYE